MMKNKMILISLICILILGIYYYVSNNDVNQINIEDIVETEKVTVEESTEIIVHVSGAVSKPGIVILEENSRISDAIEKAGGYTADADLTNVNLAYILQDGIKIYIPKIGEENQTIIQTNAGNNVNKSEEQSGKININTANLEELQNIPGIGEATAQKIINYREKNGKFSTIEDLTNVSGIGEAKLENMREHISIK